MKINLYNKQAIARSFSRSAATYDQAALLQHEVAEELLSLLTPYSSTTELIVDLGSGTGRNTRKLQEKFPKTPCLALDIAEGMINYGRHYHPGSNIFWLCADAEHLPFGNSCCDLVFSNLMLQWSNNLSQNFAEMRRILRSNGLIALSSFGPASLMEWKNCWLELNLRPPVHEFLTQEELLQALIANQFKVLSFQRRIYTKKYAQAFDLLIELKKIGANNAQKNSQQSLALGAKLQQAIKRYKPQADGSIMASYEIFFVIART